MVEEPHDLEEYAHSPILPLGLALLSCLAIGFALHLSSSAPLAGGLALAVAVLTLLCEVQSPPIGAFGFLPIALPIYLASATTPLLGIRVAAFLVLLGLSCRTLARGADQWHRRGLELISDLFPSAVLLLVCQLVGAAERPRIVSNLSEAGLAALPGLLYWLFWVLSPAVFRSALPEKVVSHWTLTRERSHRTLFFLVFYGVLVGQMARLESAVVVPALALLLLLEAPLAAQAQVRTIEAEGVVRKAEQAHLERSQELTRQREIRQRNEERELEAQREVFALLQKLVEELSGQSEQFARKLLSTLRHKVPCRTLALYAHRNGGWSCVGLQSPDSEGASSHGPDRSLVEDCWQSGESVTCSGDSPRALIRGEHGLAYLLPQWGVLYVGDTHPTWDAQHQDFLRRVAPHLRIYVDSARFYQMQKEALEQESGLRLQTEQVVLRLSQVLDALHQLTEYRDPEALLERTFHILGELVSHRLRYLVSEHSRWMEPHVEHLAPPLAEMMQAGSPIVGLPAPWQGTWLSFPIQVARGEQRRAVAWTALYAGPEQTFQPEDRETLRLFLWHVGSLLENAQLYSELRRTLGELKVSQAQVVQSSKLAAIGQLAAGVAHELNTPLGAICVAIDGALMALESRPEKAQQRLEKANPPIDKMREIISKLLYYSRDARSERREVDVAQVVRDSLDMVGHIFRLEGVEITLDFAPAPGVYGNSNEIQQVITNLLMNAKDACLTEGASGKRIVVRTYQQGSTVVLEVEDQGCGMSEETARHIFEPFFTTKPVGKGTGLGLSTTMLILEQHRGQMTVDSQVGKGTLFTVRLPQIDSSCGHDP